MTVWDIIQLHFCLSSYKSCYVLLWNSTQSYLYVCEIPVVLQKKDGLLLTLLVSEENLYGAAGEAGCPRRGRTHSQHAWCGRRKQQKKTSLTYRTVLGTCCFKTDDFFDLVAIAVNSKTAWELHHVLFGQRNGLSRLEWLGRRGWMMWRASLPGITSLLVKTSLQQSKQDNWDGVEVTKKVTLECGSEVTWKLMLNGKTSKSQ